MGKNDYGSSAWGSGWARGAFGGGAPSSGRGRRIWFKPDHESFGEFILSDQMRDVVTEVADDIAAAARELAVRDSSRKSKRRASADKYRVDRKRRGTMKVHRASRVAVRVVNPDPVALYNEFGNKNTKRRRPLGRAGALFGDFKPDGGPT